ncbi:hypothetical protein ROZALSC1DRAFT_31513, partial [Rozella allomycis CSF55]
DGNATHIQGIDCWYYVELGGESESRLSQTQTCVDSFVGNIKELKEHLESYEARSLMLTIIKKDGRDVEIPLLDPRAKINNIVVRVPPRQISIRYYGSQNSDILYPEDKRVRIEASIKRLKKLTRSEKMPILYRIEDDDMFRHALRTKDTFICSSTAFSPQSSIDVLINQDGQIVDNTQTKIQWCGSVNSSKVSYEMSLDENYCFTSYINCEEDKIVDFYFEVDGIRQVSETYPRILIGDMEYNRLKNTKKIYFGNDEHYVPALCSFMPYVFDSHNIIEQVEANLKISTDPPMCALLAPKTGKTTLLTRIIPSILCREYVQPIIIYVNCEMLPYQHQNDNRTEYEIMDAVFARLVDLIVKELNVIGINLNINKHLQSFVIFQHIFSCLKSYNEAQYYFHYLDPGIMKDCVAQLKHCKYMGVRVFFSGSQMITNGILFQQGLCGIRLDREIPETDLSEIVDREFPLDFTVENIISWITPFGTPSPALFENNFNYDATFKYLETKIIDEIATDLCNLVQKLDISVHAIISKLVIPQFLEYLVSIDVNGVVRIPHPYKAILEKLFDEEGLRPGRPTFTTCSYLDLCTVKLGVAWQSLQKYNNHQRKVILSNIVPLLELKLSVNLSSIENWKNWPLFQLLYF